ncbi:winged helix-turn-helix transcriptional regulator [Sphaerisporangium corydalis]|uniref:Winged helix-turn-helix transcriptional regulator n=1 Tax=Sphaerisporangium corydalis TaxID=1441875 RepID=A0ABV9E9R8_9ACTN|nr:helix-turn-helix domain-containing protein [Sphaerisporangium corydalis]
MTVGRAVVTGEPVGSCADYEEDCGIREVLDRIGDKWSVLVIVELAQGVRRFRALQRAVPGISQRMLTLTVRRLERDGVISRTVHATIPPQVEYELTATGHSLTHLVKALADWSAEHHQVIADARRRWDTANPDSGIR